jgi:ATP-binding cassette subfamily C protein CydC
VKDLLRLLRLLGPARGWKGREQATVCDWMALGALLALITLVANVALMATSGWFIAAMAVAGAGGVSMNYFTPAALIRAAAILRTLGRYLERLVTHEATLRQVAWLRVWFYAHLEPLAPARLQQFHSGDLFSRIRADIDALDHLYLRTLVPAAVAAAGLALCLAFLAAFDLGVALFVLGMLLVAGVLVPLWALARGAAPGRRLVETQAELRSLAVDGIQGLPELLVYGAEAAHAERLYASSLALTADQDRMNAYASLSGGSVTLAANLALWGVLWLAIPLVGPTGSGAPIAPPSLALLARFTLAAFEAVAPLPAALQHLGGTLAAARRLFEIVDAEPAVLEPTGPSPLPQRFDLEVAAVRFSYPGALRPALAGIDLWVPAGGRVAVVGATGSGKSTLFNLLLRFWAPDQGQIRLGGHDLATFRGEDLRRQVAVVSQHSHLFDATIRDNLLLANPQAPQGALEQACQAAQIHDFIAGLPEGYDTWAGETGVRLSGGQARRVAVARALLKDAPILLLDEPTEGLDAPTERALMAAIDQLMRGRTVLLITHRPLGLTAMDEILVLDAGRIVERGTHRDLLSAEHYPRLLGLR